MSSFRKKTTSNSDTGSPLSINTLPGIRPYVSSVPGFMTSTGIPSLDAIIGPGGVPLGTCTLIKEDVLTGYARLLLDYVIAQGLACGHCVCHVSANGDEQAAGNIDHVMGLDESKTINNSNTGTKYSASRLEIEEDDENEKATKEFAGNDEKMKIAWRYENMRKLTDDGDGFTSTDARNEINDYKQIPYHRVFDLTKTYSQNTIREMKRDGRISIINAKNILSGQGFNGLLSEIANVIEKSKNLTTPNVLRLVIRSLGSPLWYSGDETYATSLYKFIITLKSLIHPLNAICIISIPAYMYNDSITSPNWLIRRLEWAADAVFGVESFAGTSRILPLVLTSTYHGLIHPHKRFASFIPDPEIKLSTFAFKCRRRKFDIQVFYLPPEEGGSDRPESTVSDSAKSGGLNKAKKGAKFVSEENKEEGKRVRFVGKIDF